MDVDRLTGTMDRMEYAPARLKRLKQHPSMLLAGVLFATFVLASACSGDVEDEPAEISPTATLSGAIASATSEPGATSGPESATLTVDPTPAPARPSPETVDYPGYGIFGDFTYAPPVDFPEDLMMVVETGCTQCDSGPDGLYRVWRNDGETHVEPLIDAGLSGSDNATITSFALRPNLSEIVVTICTRCETRPLIESPVEVFRSIDGGITWRGIYTAAAGAPIFAQAITDAGMVLSDLEGELAYLRGPKIEPPAGAAQLLHDSNRAGELRWIGDDGSSVLDGEGNAIARVEPGSLVDAVAAAPDGPSRNVLGWALGYVDGPFEGWVVTRPGPDGRLTGFRFDTIVAPVAVLANGVILGSMSTLESPYGGTIGFIDVLTGKLTPIHGPLIQAPFGDGSEPVGRNMPLGAVQGPFLRVTTGINCLPIRATTEVRSRELTCAADGTLVYDLESTVTVGGQEWEHVRLLDGRDGYAVSGYLTAE